MLKLMIGAALIGSMLHQGAVVASEPLRSLGTKSAARGEELHRSPSAAELIHQRALYQARNRVARLESRKWQGVSPSRPYISAQMYHTNLNQTPWGGFGAQW